ncbi:hypothetical protein [Leptospira kirschneri]|uniref:Uncharacterized protein n=1 Tax=Leptospira kirschneri str. 200802841 TaxID=1193047 RepID=A0A828Y6Z5_9LEPT|nr:hypothetical protein [Leptospira kirschneri]EMO77485.1 hypothetical protein LEP1GSC127_0195 [Leptospira kirschneri str. 200801925]EKO50619.1 hypothetical protein LEP1GSC131_0690 [Leptospira kirschneri str. 200802841]EKP03948.1 hypothetical protein LEP1GSC018_0676 [Leptospira kirschneri str. 2008720114]EMK15574.1 hypothetical protein LEP1GSC042_1729 [Leptospira kirschneri serovar Bim str. PUO 1247]EMN03212.1 hypothetical protein LEP1GSC046_3298 [Leptospira kirschneri serovar Bim str. 1051]
MFQILLKPENKTNVYLLFEYKSYLDNLIELVKKFIFTKRFYPSVSISWKRSIETILLI